ncbi:hypothetical protein FACS189459_4510 [Bacilli bacterium]|nr:hypothetical protein FACS189459_4510 [Bacilli bacterium]
MKGIFGTKIGMTSIFDTEGKVLPVSVVYCEPNTVIENKNTNKYGHICLKVGFGEAKEKNKSKSHNGIFKKQNLPINKFIRTITNGENLRVGDKITVDTFTVGD